MGLKDMRDNILAKAKGMNSYFYPPAEAGGNSAGGNSAGGNSAGGNSAGGNSAGANSIGGDAIGKNSLNANLVSIHCTMNKIENAPNQQSNYLNRNACSKIIEGSINRNMVLAHSKNGHSINWNAISIQYKMNRNAALAHSNNSQRPNGFSQNDLLNQLKAAVK